MFLILLNNINCTYIYCTYKDFYFILNRQRNALTLTTELQLQEASCLYLFVVFLVNWLWWLKGHCDFWCLVDPQEKHCTYHHWVTQQIGHWRVFWKFTGLTWQKIKKIKTFYPLAKKGLSLAKKMRLSAKNIKNYWTRFTSTAILARYLCTLIELSLSS